MKYDSLNQITIFSYFIVDLYGGQLDSSALLYSETEDNGMSSFWSEYVQFNGFNLEPYSGDFPEILNLFLKVSHRCLLAIFIGAYTFILYQITEQIIALGCSRHEEYLFTR